MEVTVLGNFQLSRDGVPLRTPPGRARAIVALLALRANTVVSTEKIIDTVWGDCPPDSVRKGLQTSIWRVRRVLGPADASRLESWDHGYLLRLEPGKRDLDLFETWADQGERMLCRGHAKRSGERFKAALDLWCGDPLEGVRFDGQEPGELVRLAELRLAVRESWIDAEIAAGRAEAMIPEIRSYLIEHPYRERVYGQLMNALNLCGRRIEALDVFSLARTRLRSEFGVDPGEVLQKLHQLILGGRLQPLRNVV